MSLHEGPGVPRPEAMQGGACGHPTPAPSRCCFRNSWCRCVILGGAVEASISWLFAPGAQRAAAFNAAGSRFRGDIERHGVTTSLIVALREREAGRREAWPL